MNDSDFNQYPDDSGIPPHAGSTGRRLAALREQQGWTVEQVAGHLNLAPRQVLAIENDDFAALPGMAVARGFVRAYAKLLRVDPAPFMAAMTDSDKHGGLGETPATRKPISGAFSEHRAPLMSNRTTSSKKPLAIVLLLIILAAAGWMLYQAYRSGALTSASGIGDSPKVEGQEAGSVTEVVPPTVPGAAESPAQETPGPSEPNAPGSVAPSVSAAPERSSDVSASSNTEAADAIKPASGEAAPGEKDVLVIDFRGDSWMELRRAGDGKSMVSKVFKAGTTETFETSGPVTLIIGNASGVDVSYRGKPVEVKSAQGNNVARLNLK